MQLDAHVSPDAERGAGLILQCGGRYLFVLAGNRYRNAESTFFAGIGGHLEAGETWLDCLRREAIEEIGAPVRVLDSETFYRITPDDRAIRATPLSPGAAPRPIAVVEIHIAADAPWNARRQPHSYFIAVFRGRLEIERRRTPVDVDGLIYLPAPLVLASLTTRLTLGDLLDRGGELVEKEGTPRDIWVFPYGSARAMALLMRAGEPF